MPIDARRSHDQAHAPTGASGISPLAQIESDASPRRLLRQLRPGDAVGDSDADASNADVVEVDLSCVRLKG